MTPEESKLKAKASARARSINRVRRTSSLSTDNTESQVAESPPTVYQAPQINVPQDMHEAAKLIKGELEKIATSQTVLLSLWQNIKEQGLRFDPQGIGGMPSIFPNPGELPGSGFEFGAIDGNTYLDFHLTDSAGGPVNADHDARINVTPNAGGDAGSYPANLTLEAAHVHLISLTDYPTFQAATGYVKDGDGTVYSYTPKAVTAANRNKKMFAATDWSIRATGANAQTICGDMNVAPAGCAYFAYGTPTATNAPPGSGACLDIFGLSENYRLQLVGDYGANKVHFRTRNGDNKTWHAWATLATAASVEERLLEERARLKAEIYAELLALNPGIVIPTNSTK